MAGSQIAIGRETVPDWPAIRGEYVAGAPMALLCERHNITYDALDKRIQRGGWVKIRSEAMRKTSELAAELFARNLAQKQVECRERQVAESSELLERALELARQASGAQDLLVATRAWDLAMRNLRSALGMETTPDTVVDTEIVVTFAQTEHSI
ncbi:MAG TPA: hypothetical protein PKX74_12910 [Leptospiraceae bacterium]|nr:hypothetical protein [Leptospiraceae bacterium]HNN60631.1 hypothetical protein [Leptospiraceae bacterium]